MIYENLALINLKLLQCIYILDVRKTWSFSLAVVHKHTPEPGLSSARVSI